jgi:thioredoxin reductase
MTPRLDPYDAIIIGGGPAGLSAALMLGRTRRRVLLLDSGEYRNARAGEMHNVATHDGRSPAEYRRLARQDLARYPTVELATATVETATGDAGDFTVRLADGAAHRARRLLLATGLADDLPPIPGLDEMWGRSALHCPYCHGYEVRDTPLAVLGNPHAARLALLLTRLSPDVVIVTNGGSGLEPSDRALLQRYDVGVRDEPIARFEHQDGQLERIVFADGSALDRHAIFVSPAWRQRSPLPAQLGCHLFPDGTVEVDDFQKTTVPGVMAAGDMARRPGQPMSMAAVSVAAGSGVIAAASTDQGLLMEDFFQTAPAAHAVR